MRLVLTALFMVVVLALTVRPSPADVDPGPKAAAVLTDLVDQLDAVGVKVLLSHDSEQGRMSPSFGDPPRIAPLVGFRAWPGVTVDLDRYGEWLDAFESGARGALAAVPSDEPRTGLGREAFTRIWEGAGEGERVVVTFDAADLDIAERIAGVLEANGYAVYLAIAAPEREPLDPDALGQLFVEADHHLVIDTAAARLNPVIQFEAELLAELRRQDAWVALNDPGLPPVKRGSMDVIEALGALPMQVLPGGIVLGMRPVLDQELAGAVLAGDGSDYALDVGGRRIVVEQVSDETRDAIRAFVAIADSHSVVDIAGGSVTLSDPFHDTRIGERMTHADRMPFEHLSIRGAAKSLIVDQAIRVRGDGDGGVAVDVTLEVRFYRRDDGGHADRLASLRFTVEDATGSARLLDLAWSRRPGLRISFDGSGVDALVHDLEKLALDAALIALARL